MSRRNRPIQLRPARRSHGRRAAAHAQAPCGPHRPLASGGIRIFLGLLCKSPSHLLVRHPRVAGDTAKTPAFLDSRHHRRDHRGIDHGVETLAQSDDEPEPLRRGQSAETITEPCDVSSQKTDPRILIHLLRMLMRPSGVKSCDTNPGSPVRSYPTPKLAAARVRRARGESPTQIAKALGISRASVYRHLSPESQED
jgi:hypothetical protein